MGIGHDMSEQFTNQWWDHVFNKAAAKVMVECDGKDTIVRSEKDLNEEKKSQLKRKMLYGNFVKVFNSLIQVICHNVTTIKNNN